MKREEHRHTVIPRHEALPKAEPMPCMRYVIDKDLYKNPLTLNQLIILIEKAAES